MSEAPSRSAARRGRTLKLYLVDGTPSGVITAELGVSSVRAAVASRTALPELIRREEATRTGVYLLVGPDPDLPGRQLVYVGEGDQVRTRLAYHDGDEAKEFFTRAVLIVSKDENLTKAHGRYLEGRIIAAIRNAGRAKLVNGTEPPFRGLPEPEIADMERVLDEIEILLPVLGFDVLRPAGHEAGETVPTNEVPRETVSTVTFGNNTPALGAQADSPPVFIAVIKKAKARATERAGEFVVLEGSTAYREFQDSQSFPLRSLRQELLERGALVADRDSDLLRFTQDVSFSSPSAASSLVGGYSDSGPRTWKLELTGQSYGDWRKRRIEQGGAA
ncbi:GIY-YIG nuclease family protein [Rhizobium bangladeshense]|uniref:GIY-YIG nuclease family protein n=1 Tax=Rhizobium bangladeshense TaxID=1138189 RepID=UPI001C82F238|nr:GIY-YIG nuclease family protein [Rhizobium bangladeshense]MBX4887992.1 GIY-YIG nuclease family protein [Rhizobium bangladeshense]